MKTPGLIDFLTLQLVIKDSDSLAELIPMAQGQERDDYALGALRIGLLSLKHARGQVDADAVRRESERLLSSLGTELKNYRSNMQGDLTFILKEYFDPTSGKFPERIDRLIKKDGDLELVLDSKFGQTDVRLVQTLTEHLGENSPLMRMLNPKEAAGFITVLQTSIVGILSGERELMLREFSLDKKDSALSRLVSELTEENGHLVEGVVKEFSLDDENSALSRLVKKVEFAQQTITKEFSLDNVDSALCRLRDKVIEVLERSEKNTQVFQQEVRLALDAMKVRKDEALRSTTHGAVFEDLVTAFIQKEAQATGDLVLATGNIPGEIRNCKVGDVVITLGSESAAAGENIVIEAKESSSYNLKKAREEIEVGRKNRSAQVGIFIFSRKTAPDGQGYLVRYENDIFVIWDAEDAQTDVMLKAALSTAKALCFKKTQVKKSSGDDFARLNSCIISIEKEAERLGSMKTWSETIQSNSGKILDEVRKMGDNLVKQIQVLKDSTENLSGLFVR